MVIKGPMDGAFFNASGKAFLGPTLAPGDIVMCGNLSSHQIAKVRKAIESVGATLNETLALLEPVQYLFRMKDNR